MAEIDYNEILLEAIDAIVVSRISEVNFDRTIVATIVDASKAKDGEYVLSDGSVQFTVRNGNNKYKENDKVNVLIPSNDFSSTEKTILGKTSANVNDVPVTYVSPLEKIVPMETNYAAGLKGGITANGETEVFQLTNAKWIKVNESTLGYDTLCVSARFKTLLNEYDIRQGHYGLLVQLKTNNGYIHALTLDSAKDMFGNPYGYSMYITQEQTYHLNLQDDIVGVKIDLYQMKDFKYNDGVNSELQALPVMPYNNILVDNINVSFGYNAEQVEDNTAKIGTADSLTYNNIKDALVTKKLALTWYNKDKNNKYLGFTDGAFDTLSAAQIVGDKKYYIKWEHSLNNGQWEELQKTGREQELTVNLNMTWALNEYRAIVVFDGVFYTSNIIQFKNATGIDNPQEELQMSLTLHNVKDSSYDSYPLYGPDSMIINPLDSSKNRKVYFSYASDISGSLEPDVLNGATVYFYIPQNSTMLEAPGGETNWDDNQDSKHNKTGYIAYVKRFAKDLNEITLEAKTFLYRIKKNYNPLFTNNSIILRVVDKNGFIYETSKTFTFSSYGTSGTDYSIIVSGASGENGWVGSNSFTPKAQLYDANYKEVLGIDWNWLRYPTGATIQGDQSLASTTMLYQVIKAQTTVSWVGKNIQISGIYPISYSSNKDYMYQGPTTIVYNSNGIKPSYYDGNLGIFKKSDNSEVACTWSIEYFTEKNEAVSGNKAPWLSWGQLTDTKDGHTRFKPSSMYLGDKDAYYLVLIAKSGAKILWRQPLIILQNQYASGLLNNWDGNLIVDNEGNYILSSMMGAGSKDNQNRFSGVLMGEVSKVADNAAETGLFGYHEGVQSFGFKTDGTAFIGKAGGGRIEFNGTQGTISSKNYTKTEADGYANAGMYIGLQNGEIRTKGFQVDGNGNARFKGEVTATSLTLEPKVKISTNSIDGLSSVATSGDYKDLINQPTIQELGLDTSTIIFKGDITQTTKKDSNGNSYTETSVPSANGSVITYSTYDADDYIVFGRGKEGDNFIINKDGLLTAHNAIIHGTIYATDGEFTGAIKGGTIAIGGTSNSPNFHVDENGNVTLNGNITWGASASPTQIVYASYKSNGTAPTKPADNKAYSSFPPSATAGNWHQTLDTANDFFGSYTYDGGKTWGPVISIKGKDGQNGKDGADGKDGQNGANGDTIRVIQAYYRSNSASPPSSKPSGSTYPSGWSTTPHGVIDTQKYEYISQCTVTNTTYGAWSSPVLFARYGSDGKNGENGSDATVNALNIYNAVTNNGKEQGCFTYTNNKLYINAEFINTGILRVGNTGSEIFFADINEKSVEIGGWTAQNYALTANNNGFIGLYNGNLLTATVNNHSASDWRIVAGTSSTALNFGVDKSGNLYCSNANITGTIHATGGKIGNFTISTGLSSTGALIAEALDPDEDSSAWNYIEINGYTDRTPQQCRLAPTSIRITNGERRLSIYPSGIYLNNNYRIKFTEQGGELVGTWTMPAIISIVQQLQNYGIDIYL